MASASDTVMQAFLIVIGVVAITSVILINRFMKTVPKNQRISIRALLVHAGAFGLFLVSILIYAVAWTFQEVYPGSPTAEKITATANLLCIALDLISQCFVCFIFWKLGEKIEQIQPITEKQPNEDDYVEV
jgi:hypothetical protein